MKNEKESKMMQPFDTNFLKQLQIFQDRFCEYFGVAAAMFDDKGDMITQPSNFSSFCKLIRSTEKGLKKCADSKKNLFEKVADGKPLNYKCAIFEELADAIVPIMWEGKVVAAWGVGQRPIKPISEDNINKCAKEIGVNSLELCVNAQEFEVGTLEEFNKAIFFLNDIAIMVMKLHANDVELRDNLERFSTLASISAHHMRESLGTILGFAGLLEARYSGTGDKEFNEFITYIIIYAEKLKQTTELLIKECNNR